MSKRAVRGFRLQTSSAAGCLALLCGQLAVVTLAQAETASPETPKPSAAPSAQADSPIAIPSPEQMNADPASAGLALFDLLEGAEKAEKSKDYATAVKYYVTLARLVPDHATAFSKLCEMYELLGQRDQGIAACFRATGLEGAKVADNLRYLRLMLSTPPGQGLSPTEATRVRETLEHLARAGIESAEVDLLACQYSVAIENREALRGCVQRLEQTQAGSPITITYKLSLALFERDFRLARAIIEEARKSGMGAESIALMERQLDAMQNGTGGEASGLLPAGSRRWLAPVGGVTALAAAGLALWIKRRRPKVA